jgi:DNA polymerase
MSVKFIPGTGPKHPLFIIVGEAPGAEEEKAGQPFVGKSGQMLDKVLEDVGLRRSDIYITNVVKVRPTGNKTPTKTEAESWMPLLKKELKQLHNATKVIIPLGNCAAQAILESKVAVTKVHGETQYHLLDGETCKVIPTFHPAYIIRNNKNYAKWKKDFENIKKEVGIK